MTAGQPGTQAASGKLLQTFVAALLGCTGGHDPLDVESCCYSAGIAAVRPLIEAEVRADERRKIADELDESAVRERGTTYDSLTYAARIARGDL